MLMAQAVSVKLDVRGLRPVPPHSERRLQDFKESEPSRPHSRRAGSKADERHAGLEVLRRSQELDVPVAVAGDPIPIIPNGGFDDLHERPWEWKGSWNHCKIRAPCLSGCALDAVGPILCVNSCTEGWKPPDGSPMATRRSRVNPGIRLCPSRGGGFALSVPAYGGDVRVAQDRQVQDFSSDRVNGDARGSAPIRSMVGNRTPVI